MNNSIADAQRHWFDRVPERFHRMVGFEVVVDDPELPRALLLGDSISIGYTVPARKALAGRANVHRVPDNARSTRETLRKLDAMLYPGRWDVIHFNCGIHDITRKRNGVVDAEGEPQVPIDEYEGNLVELVGKLRRTAARLLWARTTAIRPYEVRRREDLEAYNAVADRVMAELDVPINDLFSLSSEHLDLLNDKVHFTAEGSRILGRQVAEKIAEFLDAGKE